MTFWKEVINIITPITVLKTLLHKTQNSVSQKVGFYKNVGYFCHLDIFHKNILCLLFRLLIKLSSYKYFCICIHQTLSNAWTLAMQWNFLRWWKRPPSVQSNVVTTSALQFLELWLQWLRTILLLFFHFNSFKFKFIITTCG